MPTRHAHMFSFTVAHCNADPVLFTSSPVLCTLTSSGHGQALSELVSTCAQLRTATHLSLLSLHLSQGMGEPLSNYDAVVGAVRAMTHPQLFGLARRHVTISTVGVIPRIKSLHTDLPVRRHQ